MGEETLIVADAERGTIQWGPGTLGVTSLLRCPCDLVDVPRYASRMCGGDFLTGAVWMESNKSACEFDSLSFQLCGATVSWGDQFRSCFDTFLVTFRVWLKWLLSQLKRIV